MYLVYFHNGILVLVICVMYIQYLYIIDNRYREKSSFVVSSNECRTLNKIKIIISFEKKRNK